jgi:outer membrane lipoprotein-sorting protein
MLLALLLVVGSNCNIVVAQKQNPSPNEIIKLMVEQYAAVTSYRDSGVVETATGGSLPTRSTDVAFKIYFTRPRKLHFEWVELSSFSSAERNVVWSDGEKTFGYYSFEPGKVKPEEDLGMGLAGATGVSLGSAITVPNLLLKDVGGFSLVDLKRISLKGEEQFEGEACYVLEGFHPNSEPWQFWVGKKDFLLRKLTTRRENGELEEEIHRDIRVNEPIPDEKYRLKVTPDGLAPDTIDKEKEQDIKRLLSLILPRDRMNYLLADVLNGMKKAMPQVPEKVWQEVTGELHFNSELLVQIYIPLYDSYYTDDEIKQLITFYESPLGKKVVRSSILIELEADRHGKIVGRELIKRISDKLRAKGYATTAT